MTGLILILTVPVILLLVALAGVVHDRLRGSDRALRHDGDDTLARHYRDVGDSHAGNR